MAAPEPSATAANIIGDQTERTWAYLRSPVWPGNSAYSSDNYVADHNIAYGTSYDVNGDLLPLLKSFQKRQAIGTIWEWNLPIGAHAYEDPDWTPPDPNPDNLVAKIITKLCLGFAIGPDVYQGTIYTNPFDPPGFHNVLGYDYETTKAGLIGAQVNVTCRFWPIPYVDEYTWDSFTATVTVDATMFPENQDSTISSNIYGGITVFVGSGQYVAFGTPTLYPPNPITINWIQMPT